MITSIDNIDKVLPQTQCTKCGYDDCYSYAKAITNGEKHNKCVTGGNKTIKDLSKLLKKEVLLLDNTLVKPTPTKIAKIDESLCIGCTKCILACPVDAIVGAKKLMHTIITNECTGCDLCIEPCPMDCINVIELPESKQLENLDAETYENQKEHYKNRYSIHKERVEESKKEERNSYKNIASATDFDKKAYIMASLKKFRNKKKSL